MSRVAPTPRRRPPAATALVLLALLVGAAGCSGDDDDAGANRPTGSGASRGAEATDVRDVITVAYVKGGQMGDARRQQLKKDVGAVVDGFLDHAYLGSFPRSDYSAAFADFTPQAATLATRQLAVLSNQSISDQISKATLTDRRVRLTVLAPKGLPRGATARFVLDFATSGGLTQDQRVLGQLYLTKPKGGAWQVFGFRVDQAVTR